MAEKKIADGIVRDDSSEFESDTTGDVKMSGIRHIMQEQMQAAGDGVFEKRSNKALSAVPKEGSPVALDTASPKPAAKRKSAKRK